jgi:hypothetical protein
MNPGIFKLPTLIGIVGVMTSGALAGQYSGFDLQTVAPAIAIAEHSPQTPTQGEKRDSFYDSELSRSGFVEFLSRQGLDFVMPAGVISEDKSIAVGLSERPVSELVTMIAEGFGAIAEQRAGVWYFRKRQVVVPYSEIAPLISSQANILSQAVISRDRRLDLLISSLTQAQVNKAGRVGYLTIKELSTKQRALVPKHLLVAAKGAPEAKIRLPKESLPVYK